MRKNKRKVLISIVSLMIFLLGGCTGYGEHVTEGSWSAYLGENDAFVYEYRWDGTDEGLRIDPPAMKGLPVTRYGGYMGRGVPMQFSIKIPGAGLCRQKVVPKEEIIGTIEFTLVVGSRISDIIVSNYGLGGYYLLDEQEDAKCSYYKVIIHPEVDPANTKYYEQDGKLYARADDSLIPDICYELEEAEQPAIREKRVKNAEGELTVYEYDPDGLIQQETKYEANGSIGRKISYAYQEKDWLKVKVITDEQENPTYYECNEYDEKGNVTATYKGTNKDDAVLDCLYVYKDGKLTLETNYNTDGTIFNIIQYEYNNENQLVDKTERSEDGYVYRNWKYTYNEAGTLVHLTDTYYEHRIEYSYDEKERPILEKGYYNDQPSYEIKQIFGQYGITDYYFERMESEEVTHEKTYYDDMGRKISTVNVDAKGRETKTASWEYDERGNLIHYKAVKGYEYTAEYNEYGYPVKIHDVCTDMLRNAGTYDIQEEIEYFYYSSAAK